EDAAALLLAVITAERPERVELGCDGRPVTRQEYYTHLATRMGLPAPRVAEPTEAAQLGLDPERLSRTTSKALDHVVTCRRTGWLPQHTDYRLEIDALLTR
ncbi:MAG: hypothetical protein AAGC55_34065, partial [Myxococcota bacterium]